VYQLDLALKQLSEPVDNFWLNLPRFAWPTMSPVPTLSTPTHFVQAPTLSVLDHCSLWPYLLCENLLHFTDRLCFVMFQTQWSRTAEFTYAKPTKTTRTLPSTSYVSNWRSSLLPALLYVYMSQQAYQYVCH